MEGIKNKGYNNIELVNPLFSIELTDLLQGIADGTTFNLIDGETDIALGNIHSNYKVEDLVKLLCNGSFNSFGLKYTLIEDDLPPVINSYNIPFARKTNVNQNVYFQICALVNSMIVQFTINAYIALQNENPYALTILAETVSQQP